VTKNPQVTNYWFVTYASVFGDDPNPAVRALIKALKQAGSPPATGGFIGGAAAIDGVATAIKRAHGSTKGTALAAQLQRFKKVPTLGGKVSFSPQLHTVFGRQYRVIEINNNKARYVGAVTAKVLPKL
jgi:branched-chain amino acid transport system substrate-binding protein